MHQAVKTLLLGLGLALLAGCGGQQAAPTNPPPADEPAATTPQAPASAPQAGEGGETFQVEITGDLALSLASPVETVKLFYQDIGAQTTYLQFGDEFGLPILLLFFGVGDTTPIAGQYELVIPPAGMIPDSGSVSASANILSEERDANDVRLVYVFDQPEGTFTLEQEGDTYSGSFDFTLKGRLIVGTEYTKTVRAVGSFSGVKMSE